jgi:exosortase family protein XrtF
VKDFRPALFFVFKFVLIYILGNMLYGLFIQAYRPGPDPVTELATRQTVHIVGWFTTDVSAESLATEPVVSVSHSGRIILRVFEGCSGLNVMIVFVAFLVAFGGQPRQMLIFGMVGIALIHVGNLARIVLLFYTASWWPMLFYYFHKYLFTACLYLLVFALWYVWISWSKKRMRSVAH